MTARPVEGRIYRIPDYALNECRYDEDGVTSDLEEDTDSEEEQGDVGEGPGESVEGQGNAGHPPWHSIGKEVVGEESAEGEEEEEEEVPGQHRLAPAEASTEAPEPGLGGKKRRRSKDKAKKALIRANQRKRRRLDEPEPTSLGLLQFAYDLKNSARAVASMECVECPTIHGKGLPRLPRGKSDDYPRTEQELEQAGYTIVRSGSNAVAAVDREERPIVVRARKPDKVERSILSEMDPVLDSIARARGTAGAAKAHARGDFTRVQLGIYHGTGSKQPHPLVVRGKEVRAHTSSLVDSSAGKAMMNHLRSTLMTWFPEVAKYLAAQHDMMKTKLPAESKHLTWPESPFTTATLNLGPVTITNPHRDGGNVLAGLCAIFISGGHKAKDGALLAFKEIKMAFELGAGDLILFPSALLTHWNTSLSSAKSVRRSLVFWTGANAVRYYAMGGKLMKDLDEDELIQERARMEKDWTNGLRRFCTLEQLIERVN